MIAERLLAAGVRGVVFDLLLPKPGVGDDLLKATIARHPNQIVFGANFTNDVVGPGQQTPAINPPTDTVMANVGPENPAIGYVNFWPGFDGIIRAARYRTTLELLEAEKPWDQARGPADGRLRYSDRLGRARGPLAN